MNQQSYLLDSDASNPKITNLLTSYSRAKYDLIWQNDSNLIVEPYLLKNLVSSLKHNVGIVHQVISIFFDFSLHFFFSFLFFFNCF